MPLMLGSLVIVNSKSSAKDETTFSAEQKQADSAKKAGTLMIVSKEK